MTRPETNKGSVFPGAVELLFNKLRRPIHYSYIARYILGESEERTLEILNKLKSRGILEEGINSSGYFVNSSGPSGPSSL